MSLEFYQKSQQAQIPETQSSSTKPPSFLKHICNP